MQHAPTITFDVNDEHDAVRVKTLCHACTPLIGAITIPLSHLSAITLALIAACGVVGLDVGTEAEVVPFHTVEERVEFETRVVEQIKKPI